MRRVLTAAGLAAVVVGCVLFAPPAAAALVLGAFWLIGVWEWSRFARLGPIALGVSLGLSALAMLGALALAPSGAAVATLLAAAAAWWLFALVSVLRYPRRLGLAETLLAGAATLLPAWALLTVLYRAGEAGPRLVLCLLLVVWAADVGAYFVGSRFGRTRLAPQVSPRKTWEGVAGGVAVATLVGWLLDAFVPLGGALFGAVALATAFGSVLGDLNVSMFKRNCGLKDSGALLPGHGGVLDRIDSLTSAVAVFVAGLYLSGSLEVIKP